jgi:beta-galactosidase
VEAVTRRAPDGRAWRFLINHRAEAFRLPEPGHDLLTGGPLAQLPAGGCAVLAEAAPATAGVLASGETAP